MGKLIVIDGGDGAGKTAQTEMLSRVLAEQGRVRIFDFPRYEASVFGALVRRLLKGEFGDSLQFSPYLASLPFMLDRLAAKAELSAALKEGHVICNRYVPSNLAHQMVRLPAEQRPAFIEFVERGEYEELGVPRPDLVIYLFVPAELGVAVVDRGGERPFLAAKSRDERMEYRRVVAEAYRELADRSPTWRVIDCAPGGIISAPEEIHRQVLAAVRTVV